MPQPAPLSIAHVSRQLVELGVRRGAVLLAHTSFRAVRPVEDGPRGLIAALLDAIGPDGTLVMPSWSGSRDEPFDSSTSESSADLGVVPSTFWRLPGVVRSDHAHAFAAAGPLAEAVLRDGLPIPPHAPESPVGRVHDQDGQVLLLGVGHDANTTVHLAEVIAHVPYRVPKSLTVRRDGRTVRIRYGENDHCCERFRLVDGWLRSEGLQAEGVVGHASARLVRSESVVRTVVARLHEDPLVFLHPTTSDCVECAEARASIGSATGGGGGP